MKAERIANGFRWWFSRRTLVLFVFLARATVLGCAPQAAAATEPILAPIEEEFRYNIGFLWFERVAEGRITIRRISDRSYRADLMAETKGFVGFLTNYQKNHYVSEMKYVPEKGRFITSRFTKVVTRGSKVVKSVTEIDYEKGEHRWVATENNEVKDRGTRPIPEGVIYEDILSAFFNLRQRAFGPLTHGRRLTIDALPYYQLTDEGQTDYDNDLIRQFEIRIPDAPTEQEYRRRFDRTNEKGHLVLIQVPKQDFGQKSGEIIIWFDENLIPVATRVEDVVFFGDVTGILQQPIENSEAGVERRMANSVLKEFSLE